LSSAICTTCGLPKEICQCEELAHEKGALRITVDKRRYGKEVTIIEGLGDDKDLAKRVGKDLKSKCACGGTVKDGLIVLQGNHERMVGQALEKMGFQVRK
jgi:translation initiation factor 1